MKIGFMGTHSCIKVLRTVLADRFPELETLIWEEESIVYQEETARRLSRAVEQIDGMIFGGEMQYSLYREIFQGVCPCSFFVTESAALVRAMLELAIQGVELPRISVDNFSFSAVRIVVEELGLNMDQVCLLENQGYRPDNREYCDALVTRHLDHYRDGKTEGVITPILYVAEALKQEKVPVVHVVPTKDMIIRGIRETLLQISHRLNQQNGTLCAIILRLQPREELMIRGDGLFYESIEKLRAAAEIHRFARDNKAVVVTQADDQFTILINAADLAAYTQEFQIFPMLQMIWDKTRCNFSVGIGVGYDPADSKINAEIALRKAGQIEEAGAFIAYTPTHVVGPVEYVNANQNKTYVEQDMLMRLVNRTGISLERLSRLLQLAEEKKQSHVTAQDLCNHLGISMRSANRILTSLEENGYATLAGRLSSGKAGRPFNVYRLTIKKNF